MLGYLFGFNARIGRLNFFLCSLALGFVIALIVFAITGATFHSMPKGMLLSLDQMKGPLIVVGVIFGLVTFMLQSMRFRDIGWDPVCVIPLWIALAVVDRVIAAKIPAVSLGHDHPGTIVGALVNLGLVLALTFWPSGSHETWTPNFDTPPPAPDAPPRRQDGASLAASRIARVAGGEFGRR
jgi:uncharacterized membrane protein YhaH (DUF805 family)